MVYLELQYVSPVVIAVAVPDPDGGDEGGGVALFGTTVSGRRQRTRPSPPPES